MGEGHSFAEGRGQLRWTSLAARWSRLCASIAGGVGSVPCRGAQISQAAPCGQRQSKMAAAENRPEAGAQSGRGQRSQRPEQPLGFPGNEAEALPFAARGNGGLRF